MLNRRAGVLGVGACACAHVRNSVVCTRVGVCTPGGINCIGVLQADRQRQKERAANNMSGLCMCV